MSLLYIPYPLCLGRPKHIALLVFLSCQYMQHSIAGTVAEAVEDDKSSLQQSNSSTIPINTNTPATTNKNPQSSDSGFNPAFLLQAGTSKIDIAHFNKENAILPGKYFVDLIVNGEKFGQENVIFKTASNDTVQPCFNRDLLLRVKVNVGGLSSMAKKSLKSSNDDGSCVLLSGLIDKATTKYDSENQILHLSIPQASMKHFSRDYVDPSLWSDGVNAALLQYRANFYKTKNSNGQQNGFGYLGLTGGINLGAWRLRHSGSLNYSYLSGAESHFNYASSETYLQRSVPSIKSKLSFGDLNSDGSVLDSFTFRGVQLASDNRMYPYFERGYLPVIHGTANSNAHVKITQNGVVLYETNVPAGSFEIKDFYPSGYGGEIKVSVTEANGSVHSSIVPYAAAPTALSEGSYRYSVLAGKYRDSQSANKFPMLFQGVIQHGFTNLITGYAGVTTSKRYFSGMIGSALSSGYGALGVDFSYSHLELSDNTKLFGKSVRVSYSKFISQTNTNLDVSAYQFSSRNYLNLQDSMNLQNLNIIKSSSYGFLNYRQRSRFQTTISQNLGKYGSVYLVGSLQSYWGIRKSDYQYQFGYSRQFKHFTFSFSASRELVQSHWQNGFMAMLNIPLDSKYGSFLSSTYSNYDSSTKTLNFSQGISGTSGKDRNISYGVNFSFNKSGSVQSQRNSSINTHISYQSSISSFSASLEHDNLYNQGAVGAFGSLVAYRGGVVLSPYIGNDTLGIIEADGIGGASINNMNGTKLNSDGLGIAPNLTPFDTNKVGISLEGMPIDVSLKSTSRNIIPTDGAIVLVQFKTKNTGRSAILQASLPNGDPVPFGADIINEQGVSVGSVAQGGLLAIYGLKSDKGTLTIKWGDEPNNSCNVPYNLPQKDKHSRGYHISSELVCYTPSFVVKNYQEKTRSILDTIMF